MAPTSTFTRGIPCFGMKILGGDYDAPRIDHGPPTPKTRKEIVRLWTIVALFSLCMAFLVVITIIILTGSFHQNIH